MDIDVELVRGRLLVAAVLLLGGLEALRWPDP
jgi:hypothetical protein